METVNFEFGGFDETDIHSLLKYYMDLKGNMKKFKDEEDSIKTKIKIHLKEKGWTSYNDKDTDVSVSITNHQRETIDKVQLKLILNPTQISQITKVTTIEKMVIMTPESRKRMNKFLAR